MASSQVEALGEGPAGPAFSDSIQRIRALLEANRATVATPDLSVLLPAVVAAARELVPARYAAMSVPGREGVREQFVDSGENGATTDWIRGSAEGRDLLAAVKTSSTAIRVPRDPSGFSERRSAAVGFLGLPIRIRGEVFAILCVTDAANGDFGVQDENLLSALATGAAVAIENSWLFGESKLRQLWLQACAEITGQLLSDDDRDPLALIADRVIQTAQADLVNVVLPTPDKTYLEVVVATGKGADQLAGQCFPMANTLSSLAINEGQAVSIAALASLATKSEYGIELFRVARAGPIMAIPLAGAQQSGALVVGRDDDRDPFTEADVTMTTMFADYAAVGLELAEARRREQDGVLLEDRSRIARDLHDHVIQRLYAAGLTVRSVSGTVGDEVAVHRLSDVIDAIDAIIDHIRTTIRSLRELPQR